jgi:hypothetical protein
MKSSLHSLIHFLPFILNHSRLPSPELDPILFLNSTTSLHDYCSLLLLSVSTLVYSAYSASTLLPCRTLLITTLHGPRGKTVFIAPLLSNGCPSVVACACVAGMWLPTRCLAMGIQVTIYITQICVLLVTVKFLRFSIFACISMPRQHRMHLVNVMYLPPFQCNSAWTF